MDKRSALVYTEAMSMRWAAFLLLALSPAGGGLRAQDAAAGEDALARSRAWLEELDDVHGGADPRLPEALLQVADQLMLRGRHREAHRHLDRAAQVVRVSHGLYTRRQLPYLRRKIENLAARGDWDAARKQMGHLFWLYRTKSPRPDAALMDDLRHLAALHLRGISEDAAEHQGHHFRRAESAGWTALAVGEWLWGRHDPRLAPVLYELLRHNHLKAAAVSWASGTGFELRRHGPDLAYVMDRDTMREHLYRSGTGLLRRLEEIYRRREPADRQAMAMVTLYRADWQLLFSRNADALDAYGAAHRELLEAGAAPGTVERYFSRPALIPLPRFHASLDAALAARDGPPRRSAPTDAGPLSADAVYFAEWSPAFPYAPAPLQLPGPAVPPPEAKPALFRFSLAGMPEFKRWVTRERSLRFFGRLLETSIIAPEPFPAEAEAELLGRLERLRLRPILAGGLPQESDGLLVYRPAAAFD